MLDDFKFSIRLFENIITFETHPNLFSPRGPDLGTLSLLSMIPPDKFKILDLGCGYGLIGVSLAKAIPQAKIYMTDIDPLAIKYSQKNMKLNNVENICIYIGDGVKKLPERDFDLILSNPPYHTDFSIPKSFIEKGFNKLSVNGVMLLVVKRPLWYQRKMKAIFGNVKIKPLNGYFVLSGVKEKLSFSSILKRR